MNRPPSSLNLWRGLVHDLGLIVGKQQAMLLLGSILARPLFPMLRREFGIVPGVWIHGGRSCGKSYLAESLTALFSPDPAHLRPISARDSQWRLFRNLLIDRGDAVPSIVEEWADDPPSHNKVTDLVMSLGMDPSTSTADGRIRFATPLAILSRDPAGHPSLASHCLHFTPHLGCRPPRFRPINHLPQLHRLLPLLGASHDRWEHDAHALISHTPGKIGAHLGGRPSLLMGIAWSVFVTAENLLDPESQSGKPLRHWADRNAALLFPTRQVIEPGS